MRARRLGSASVITLSLLGAGFVVSPGTSALAHDVPLRSIFAPPVDTFSHDRIDRPALSVEKEEKSYHLGEYYALLRSGRGGDYGQGVAVCEGAGFLPAWTRRESCVAPPRLPVYGFLEHLVPGPPGDHPAVRRALGLFSGPMGKSFSLWLERSGRYLPAMRRVFLDYGLPGELAYLPLIESGFNPRAFSRRRAVGPWQFIAATGKRYGLRVDWWVDERRDPIKATHAAARYLKDLYEHFGSWPLALAAYNAGEGKVRRAIRRTGSRDYWRLRKTRYLKTETKHYVPRFIAALIIAHDPARYGFDGLAYHTPVGYDHVVVGAAVDVEVAARCAGISVEELRALNPELKRWRTPPRTASYRLRVPYGASDRMRRNLAALSREERLASKAYRVRSGDSVWKIARRFGIPVKAITDVNTLNKPFLLRIGQVLRIPHGT